MNKKITSLGVLEFYQGKYGNGFTGKVNMNLFSKSYSVNIRFDLYDNGFDGLNDEIVTAAQNCLNAINNQTNEIEQTIKDYYDDVAKYRAAEGWCDYIEMDDLNQLAQVMKPEEFYISGNPSRIHVGLYFICDWDREYGCGIAFDKNGNILEIGADDVVF